MRKGALPLPGTQREAFHPGRSSSKKLQLAELATLWKEQPFRRRTGPGMRGKGRGCLQQLLAAVESANCPGEQNYMLRAMDRLEGRLLMERQREHGVYERADKERNPRAGGHLLDEKDLEMDAKSASECSSAGWLMGTWPPVCA
ncbi:hypothetical protein CIHG_09017 [Coccidioides immitis H538.4]|uniref:Uncharacterized protein n=1 Tax=Coccidioides immitis H538.4 TaxID=396776 RepID=A0A0J8S1F8_COCIT|nr:hypothetical protein CIHG_09017 [Coccidioides immitis H538.4]